MDEDAGGWARALDLYCERTGPELWSEPLNAATSLAFLVAAFLMWRRLEGRLPLAGVLVALIALIGVGSTLFHTVATVWAAVADTVPIALFVVVYVFGANLRFWGWHWWGAALGTLLFVPYAVLAAAGFGQLPFFSVSAQYWPIALLIAAYGLALLGRAPEAARGLLIGAALLTASLLARSVDEAACAAIPIGTHVLWHLLNAVLLAWMVEVYRRHAARGPGDGGAPEEAPDEAPDEAPGGASGEGALEEPAAGR